MQTKLRRMLCAGMTWTEVLAVTAALGLWAGWFLPRIARPKIHVCRISCIHNLKQIGLAFRMWSNDHAESFPWRVNAFDPAQCPGGDGAKMCGHPDDWASIINDGNLTIFRAISNELNSPKSLVCPEDSGRQRAQTFDLKSSNALVSPNQISYFVGLTADEAHPQMILSGDRSLAGGVYANKRRTWTQLQIGKADVKIATGIHAKGVNVGLSDGSADQLNLQDVRKLLMVNRGLLTNGTILQYPE